MNKIIIKFFIAGDKFMSKMYHLLKAMKKYKKFKETED